jgi:hypothetical protein
MTAPAPNPAAPDAPLNPQQLATLQQANQLMTAGDAAQAAPLFAQLAAQMEASQHPRRAANLHARAAHAFADNQQGQMALGQARGALNLFLAHGMLVRAPTFFSNITRKLNNHNMQNAASALHQEYGPRLHNGPMQRRRMRRQGGGDDAEEAAAPAAPAHGMLPTSCPKCGAPVHGAEANWIDNNTAECDYCGALLRAE